MKKSFKHHIAVFFSGLAMALILAHGMIPHHHHERLKVPHLFSGHVEILMDEACHEHIHSNDLHACEHTRNNDQHCHECHFQIDLNTTKKVVKTELHDVYLQSNETISVINSEYLITNNVHFKIPQTDYLSCLQRGPPFCS